MKRLLFAMFAVLMLFCMEGTAFAAESRPEEDAFPEDADLQEQLEALGADELKDEVPEGAKELMEETGIYDIDPENLLSLTPGKFFPAIWRLFLKQLRQPLVVLGGVLGVVLLCALLGGMREASGQGALEPVFNTVSVLCILASVSVPILDCIMETSKAIQQASLFMLSFIPIFSAAILASGQPVTGATYNLFLFGTCQVVSQVVSLTLIPLMGVYLAFCIAGQIAPDLNIGSAASAIKSAVSWVLGFILTIFVGLLSIQTMVAQSADSVTTRTAKFLIGSFVPVVGGALSDAYSAAQGCLRLMKTSLGAYGIIVAALTFLPILLQTVVWYFVTHISGVASDILGVKKLSALLKSCGSVLGVLIAIIFCYALLIIVSTTVVLVTGLGGGA